MRIAGGIFLTLGIIALVIVGLWVREDKAVDLFNAEGLTFGITVTLCGIWFLLRAKDPDLKSMEKERKEEKEKGKCQQ